MDDSVTWVRSSLSFANGNCVEVGRDAAGQILIRNSRNITGPYLVFTAEEWDAFHRGVMVGDFIQVQNPGGI